MNVAANIKKVKVEEIIWEPSMYGYLYPTIRIKSTKMPDGITITYVSGHNAKYIYDNKIGIGTIITIVRSGEVIPYIIDIVKPNKKPDMPKMKYMWNETEVDIIVVDPDEKTIRIINIKKILHFYRTIHVKYLSIGIMTKLYDNGYDSIIKIAKAANDRDESPYNISGLGKKMVDKIYDEIDKAFNRVKLPELMAGSLKFGRNLGVRKIREVINKYPNILDHCDDGFDEIKELILTVNGFSKILASHLQKI